MRSDPAAEPAPDRVERALTALEDRVAGFHAGVATAEREVREHVIDRLGRSGFKVEQALVELGPFGVGRIDPERFAMLLGDNDTELTPEAADVVHRADAVLRFFAASRDIHRIRVEPGGDLRDAVKDALSHVGRLFGASRAVELVRAGSFDPKEHGALLDDLPFRLWNRAERHLAPPLVVEVRGDDCRPAGLGEFLDGTVVIVLVVTGTTTPAPLARLITPGTYVMQTADSADLARLAESSHPGVALLFDDGRPEQAHFVHDPDGGEEVWERVTVSQLPHEPVVGRGRRPPAWLEEVVHLRALAAPPTRGVVEADGPVVDGVDGFAAQEVVAAAEPVDRLAAWLLTQTDLTGL